VFQVQVEEIERLPCLASISAHVQMALQGDRAVRTAPLERLPAVDEIAESTDAVEDRSFFLAVTTGPRRGLIDAVGHAAER
jgi:hypothetical protein